MFGVVTVDRQWYAGGTWNPNPLDETTRAPPALPDGAHGNSGARQRAVNALRR
jgi:hypothetical protein